VLTALLHTQELEERLDFGPPLFADGQALLVQTTADPPIAALADLQGRPVGVLTGSEAEDALWAAAPVSPTLLAYSSFEQSLDALTRGEVSAVADLRRRLVRGLGAAPDVAIVGQYSHAFLAPAFAPNEPGLANLVALTLQDMFTDGAYNQLYARWFPGDTPPRPEIWPGAATTTLEQAGVVNRAPDTLAAVAARGRLRVAMVADRLPFAYMDAEGSPAGYEVDLVRALAGRWLGDRAAVDFVPVGEAEGLAMVAAGDADMLIGAVEHTREVELQVDFSLTTYQGRGCWRSPLLPPRASRDWPGRRWRCGLA